MDDAAIIELRNRVDAAEKRAAAADQQAASVLEENKRLAEAMHAALGDVDRLSKDLRTREDELKRARAEAERVGQEGRRLKTDLDAAEAERARLRERAGIAEVLGDEGKVADVVPAGEVAKVVGRLIGDLRGEIPGMDLRQGEVRLKVAFAGVGDEAAIVVPGPEKAAELKDALSEVVLGFDRDVAPLKPPRPGAGEAGAERRRPS